MNEVILNSVEIRKMAPKWIWQFFQLKHQPKTESRMKVETKQTKKATAGFRQMIGAKETREFLCAILTLGELALNEALLDMGRMLAKVSC